MIFFLRSLLNVLRLVFIISNSGDSWFVCLRVLYNLSLNTIERIIVGLREGDEETWLTGKILSTTIAATPDDGKSQRKRRRRRIAQIFDCFCISNIDILCRHQSDDSLSHSFQDISYYFEYGRHFLKWLPKWRIQRHYVFGNTFSEIYTPQNM